MARILIAGESWMTTSTHVKGVDEFSVHSYVEGVGPLRAALTGRGHEVVHMPAHLVPTDFPGDAAALARYLLVEEAFVLTASRVLGRVVWESPTWEELLPSARSLTNLVTEQRDYF